MADRFDALMQSYNETIPFTNKQQVAERVFSGEAQTHRGIPLRFKTALLIVACLLALTGTVLATPLGTLLAELFTGPFTARQYDALTSQFDGQRIDGTLYWNGSHLAVTTEEILEGIEQSERVTFTDLAAAEAQLPFPLQLPTFYPDERFQLTGSTITVLPGGKNTETVHHRFEWGAFAYHLTQTYIGPDTSIGLDTVGELETMQLGSHEVLVNASHHEPSGHTFYTYYWVDDACLFEFWPGQLTPELTEADMHAIIASIQ